MTATLGTTETTPTAAVEVTAGVTTADAHAFIEHACRNWEGLVGCSAADVEDMRSALERRDTRLTHTRPAPDAEGVERGHAMQFQGLLDDVPETWRAQGYRSEAEEIADMANVGRALMEALPEGYSYNDSPAEIVSDLQNQLADTLATLPPSASPVQDNAGEVERLLRIIEADAAKVRTQNNQHSNGMIDACARVRAALSTQAPPVSPESTDRARVREDALALVVDTIMAAEGALALAAKDWPDVGSDAIRAVIDVERTNLRRSRGHIMAALAALTNTGERHDR